MFFSNFSFDLIFSFYGFSTRMDQYTSIFTKIAVHSYKILSVLAAVIVLNESVSFLEDTESAKERIYEFGYIMNSLNFSVLLIVFYYNFENLSEITERLLNLNLISKWKSTILDWVLFLICVMLIIVEFSFFVINSVVKNGEIKTQDIVLEVIYAVYPLGWSVAIQLLYISMCYKIHLYECSVYQRLKGKCHSSSTLSEVKQGGLNLQQVINLKRKVNNCLGLLSFLMLGECYCLTVIFLIFVAGSGQIELLEEYPPYNYYLLGIFHFIVTVVMDRFNYCRPSFETLYEEFEFTKISYRSTIMSLRETIRRYCESYYTVYEIIGFDRRLIVAFIATVSLPLINWHWRDTTQTTNDHNATTNYNATSSFTSNALKLLSCPFQGS